MDLFNLLMVFLNYTELQNRLTKSEEELVRLYEENERLKTDNERLKYIDSYTEGLDEGGLIKLKAKYILLHTPVNSIDVTNGRKKKTVLDFVTWQNGILKPYQEKLLAYEKEIDSYRGKMFKDKMETLLDDNPGYNHLAFLYYDFPNKESIFTPGLLSIVGLDPEEEIHKNISLIGLIGHVNKEDRDEVVRSVVENRSLKNYEFDTTGNPVNSLILNSYPLVFDERPVGVGVFVFDQKYSYDKILYHQFRKNILVGLNEVSEKLHIISKK